MFLLLLLTSLPLARPLEELTPPGLSLNTDTDPVPDRNFDASPNPDPAPLLIN